MNSALVTRNVSAGFGFIALAYVAAGSLVLSLRIHYPKDGEAKDEVLTEFSPTLPESQRSA
jgi:hypothetical protein